MNPYTSNVEGAPAVAVKRVVSRETCLREIAVWCKSRSSRQEDAKLLREAQHAYKTGPYAEPTARFAKHLEEEIAWKRKHWESLEEALRSEAAAIGAANGPDQLSGDSNQKPK